LVVILLAGPVSSCGVTFRRPGRLAIRPLHIERIDAGLRRGIYLEHS
jgi:hypothetical protein